MSAEFTYIEMPVFKKEGGLTGKRRYRRVLEVQRPPPNELLILQVEVSEWNDTREGKPGRWVCVFRDATPADIQEEVV